MIDFRDFTIFLKNPSPGKQFDINSISSFLKLIWKVFLIILVIDLVTGILIVTPLRYFYLYPFFAINYIISGLLFGYLRIRFAFGIYLCIVSHILVNCIYCFILSR